MIVDVFSIPTAVCFSIIKSRSVVFLKPTEPVLFLTFIPRSTVNGQTLMRF